jgi:hypothetical protein
MKKQWILKIVMMATVVFSTQAGFVNVSESQTQYYTLLNRISPDSCIQMSITILASDSVFATTSIIADDTSTCGMGYAVGSVTLDSFGNYAFPSGADGWLIFFDPTKNPVCMCANPFGGNGYAMCECCDDLGDIEDGDCHLFFMRTGPSSANVRCDNIFCSGSCWLIYFGGTHPSGVSGGGGGGVLLSGNTVNFNGVNYTP